jgi:hypothetical protein
MPRPTSRSLALLLGGIPLSLAACSADIHQEVVATSATGDVWVLGTFTGSADFSDGLHAGHAQPPPKSWMDPTGYDVFVAPYH